MASNGEGEVSRLKSHPKDFDPEHFNKTYKQMTPLIRSLSKNIDPKRFNVDKSLIQSYFYDKLYYVYCKYHNLKTDNPEKFKATILHSLSLYKNRLLRNAYSNKSMFHLTVDSLENLFDDSKEERDIVDTSIDDERAEKIEKMMAFFKEKLSPDAYNLFNIELNPPPFFNDKRVTIETLLEFYELPKTKPYIRLISELRKEIATVKDELRKNAEPQ